MITAVEYRRLVDRPEWMADAACIGHTDVMFPVTDPSSAAGLRDRERAKAFCRRCDVQAECLAYALSTGEQYGIWGGHSASGFHRRDGRTTLRRGGA